MKLAGRLLLGVCVLAACGDDKPAKSDAAAVHDAPVDAPIDAFAGVCMASDQCSDPTPVCCLLVHAGGEGQWSCGAAGSAATNCPYVSCRGTADPCHTPSGAVGTCTQQTFGPTQDQHYWVCI